MSKPAGVQIRLWFTFLVGLLLTVNVLALIGSIIVTRSVRAVVREAEPLATSTAAIQRDILAAQRDLFQYLAEFSDAPTSALTHLDAVGKTLAAMRGGPLSPSVAAELDKIQKSTDQYRKVLELLPHSTQGSRDWARLQEYSSTAVTLGKNVEELAKGLADSAQKEIRRRSTATARVATATLLIAIAAITASVGSVIALQHWWKKFQELIFGM